MLPDSTTPKNGEEHSNLVHTQLVKAGRRTYFFDVRSTRDNDYFLTITESRKTTNNDGSVSYDKHKLFLYKEDFVKFADELSSVIDFIRQAQPQPAEEEVMQQ